MSRRFTEAEIAEVWERRRAGELTRSIARRLGRNGSSIRRLFEDAGGVRPAPRRRPQRHLSLTEREEISRGVAAGESIRAIAGGLGRAPSTVSREMMRNGGRSEYRAHRADQAAWQRARRPQPCKLAENEALREAVEEKLADWWSPQQISGWLQHTYPDVERMHVSHETIYLSLFIQARGGLTHITSSASLMRAVAVMVFVVEPIWNKVSSVTSCGFSVEVTPRAAVCSSPSMIIPMASHGMACCSINPSASALNSANRSSTTETCSSHRHYPRRRRLAADTGSAYRLRCRGVIATLPRVSLMVSCPRGSVEAVC